MSVKHFRVQDSMCIVNGLINIQASKVNWKHRYNMPLPIYMNDEMNFQFVNTISNVKLMF
jgi:hypothetical protein